MNEDKSRREIHTFIFVCILIVLCGIGVSALTDSNFLGGSFIIVVGFIYSKLLG